LDIGALSGFDEPKEPYLDLLVEQADCLLASIDAAANAMGIWCSISSSTSAPIWLASWRPSSSRSRSSPGSSA
jgi:hypothetical protein